MADVVAPELSVKARRATFNGGQKGAGVSPTTERSPSGTGIKPILSPSSDKCAKCEKSVFPNDPQITFDGAKFHKPCAKCADCSCQITLSNFTKAPDNTLLCKTHYFKRFHEEGNYLGGEQFAHKG